MSSFVGDVKERTLDKIEGRTWEIVAIVLMIIPVVISLQVFTREHMMTEGLFVWKTTKMQIDKISIAPTMLSALYAIILHGILFTRGIGKYFESGFSVILIALNTLWTASFISIFVSSETFNIPIINQPMSSQVLMMISIILSLISMRAIAGYIWIALALMAIFRLAAINEAMGLGGVTYMLCAYLSLGIQIFNLKLLKIDRNEIMYEFCGAGNRVLEDVKNSINYTKQKTEELSQTIKDVTNVNENKMIENKK